MTRISYLENFEPLLRSLFRRLSFLRLSSRPRTKRRDKLQPGSSESTGCRIRSGMTVYTLLAIGLILAAPIFSKPIKAETRAYRVAVVPFAINAENDLAYLKNGIADMLTSRLAWENKVQVLGREQTEAALQQATGPLNEIQAQILGAKLQADYVLFGSLTIFGNSISMDAKMIDVSGQRQTLSFFNQAEGMGKVIPQINRFASDINAKIFGRQVAPTVTLTPTAAPTSRAGTTTASPAPAHDIHAHPEKLLQGGFQNEGGDGGPVSSYNPFASAQVAQPAQGSSLNPAFSSSPGAANRSNEFWRSSAYKHLISGIEIGDINGDGRIETVVATPRTVIVYQARENRLQKIFEHKTGTFVRNHSVDIADINGNGIPEIFVTALSNQLNTLSSTVLEFNGQAFQVLTGDAPWFFRVTRHPTRGKILLGQRKLAEKDPYATGIYELGWSGNELTANERVLPPRKANVLGVAYGDVANDGGDSVAAYTRFDKVNIYQLSGQQVSEGKTAYGGNIQHVLMPAIAIGEPQQKIYLPTRLRLTDLDKDGKFEIVLINNLDLAGRRLESFRSYASGQIEARIWDGLGLASVWTTRKISGRIQDFTIGDFDNDGRNELVVAVILKEGSIIATKPKSMVIAYELNQ